MSTENMPLISVIVPCFNVERYVRKCLDSILSQTVGREVLELILIDDHSTDQTPDILREYEMADPERVILICNERNMRQGAARNTGLKYARGKYVYFADSDDWLEADALEKELNAAKTHDCELVCANNIRELGDGKSYITEKIREDSFRIIDSVEKRKALLVEKIIDYGPVNKLIRRDFLLENDIFFPEGIRFEDVLWSNLIYPYVRRFYVMKDALYHYRKNEASTTLRKEGSEIADLLRVHEMKWEALKKRGMLKEYRAELEYDFILEYYVAIMCSLAVRYGKIERAFFERMQNFIRTNMPGHAENIYMDNVKEGVRLLVALLDKELSDEELASLAEILKTMPV